MKLVGGLPKSGTTWLAEALRRFDQVPVANPKESYAFGTELVDLRRGRSPEEALRRAGLRPDEPGVELSTLTLASTDAVDDVLKTVGPEPAMFVCLRPLATAIVSWRGHMERYGWECADLGLDSPGLQSPPSTLHSDWRAIYSPSTSLTRWQASFPRGTVTLLDMNSLFQNRAALADALSSLTDHPCPANFAPPPSMNSASMPRTRVGFSMLQSNIVREAARLGNQILPEGLRLVSRRLKDRVLFSPGSTSINSLRPEVARSIREHASSEEDWLKENLREFDHLGDFSWLQ